MSAMSIGENTMKINEIATDNFDLTPQERKLVTLGHILKTQASTVKDDALSNAMARVGDELTSYGATFGPKNLADVEKKSRIPREVIKKLVAFAQKVQAEQSKLKADHKDGGLDDTNNTDNDFDAPSDDEIDRDAKMYAKGESMHETTSAGSVAAVAQPMAPMQSRTGTAKTNSPKSKKKKKS